MSTPNPDWQSHLARLAHIKQAEVALYNAAMFFMDCDDAAAVEQLRGASAYIGQAMGFETFYDLAAHVMQERARHAKPRAG
jgi:hypothetical protein